MNTGCLYRLMFPNRKAYIGITKCTAEARFAQHAKAARIAKTGCAVHLAIEKYGSESVKVETLVVADAEYRKQLEPKAIEAFNTRAPHGYNLTIGGDGVCGFDDITRAKMGAANKGRKMSAETKAKLSAARKGKYIPNSETRAKIGSASRGRTLSAEHREKIGAAQRGRKMTGERLVTHLAVHKGKVVSAETRALIGSYHKGKVISSETIEKRNATRIANRLVKEFA